MTFLRLTKMGNLGLQTCVGNGLQVTVELTIKFTVCNSKFKSDNMGQVASS